MNKTKSKKKNILLRIFNPKCIIMDFGRLINLPMLIYMRPRLIDKDGNKAHRIVRGGAVLAPNHTGFFDPFEILTVFFYRRIYFLVGEIIMNSAVKGFLLRLVGCFKIDRGETDIEAMRKADALLKNDNILTIFVQGQIHRDDTIGNIKSGAVLIALKAGVPIIPMYSEKRKSIWRRKTYVIGEPIDGRDYCAKKFPSMAEIEKVTDVLKNELIECKETYNKIINKKDRKNDDI